MSQPEIDVAAHTDEALRPAAAWISFSLHIQAEVNAGHVDKARRLLESVFEAVNLYTCCDHESVEFNSPFILARSRETAAAQWGRADEGRDERLDVLAAQMVSAPFRAG